MGLYRNRVLPRLIDMVMDRGEFATIRDRVCARLAGEVVEIGFGSGLNVPHYPAAVTCVHVVEPAEHGRRLAAGRVAASRVPVRYAGPDGQSLPLGPASVDCVLITWALCTIPEPQRALSEAARVLRPGGSLHFAEHGRSPDPRVASWQERLTPLQRRVAGGCHLNRPVDQLVADSGLRLKRLENYYLPGPKVLGYMFEGVAVKAS